MTKDGTVKDFQKISANEGNFNGVLMGSEQFGASLTTIDDLDKDGINELAVGTSDNGSGRPELGTFWISLLKQGWDGKEGDKNQ